jgi:NAD+ synthase (glutamine-hydrolysing)
LGKQIALVIGESAKGYFENLSRPAAALIINVAASASALGSFVPEGRAPSWALPSKSVQRHDFLSSQSKAHAAPVAFINRVGAEESLLYDGGSCLVLPDGTYQAFEDFADGVFIVDTDASGTARADKTDRRSEGAWLRLALALGLKDNMSKQEIGAVVIGLSGGIDSAVIAALAVETIDPKKILGVALPTRYTSAESVELAKAQAQRLGMNYLELDTDAPFAGAAASLSRVLPDRQFGLTDENIQSRCRGMLLMGLTSEPAIHRMLGTDRCAVLNTGNKSEAATGYFTLYGDGVGAFGILGDLLKARVYALARELGDAVQPEILSRPPTAELRPNQTDESSLMPYRQLDAILGALIEAGRSMEGLDSDLADVLDGHDLAEARSALPRIAKMISASEFKRRQVPFAIKVTHNTFGSDRKIPLTAV